MSKCYTKRYWIEGTDELFELQYDNDDKIFFTSLFSSDGMLLRRITHRMSWNPIPSIEEGITEFIAEFSADKEDS